MEKIIKRDREFLSFAFFYLALNFSPLLLFFDFIFQAYFTAEHPWAFSPFPPSMYGWIKCGEMEDIAGDYENNCQSNQLSACLSIGLSSYQPTCCFAGWLAVCCLLVCLIEWLPFSLSFPLSLFLPLARSWSQKSAPAVFVGNPIGNLLRVFYFDG